MLYFYKTENDNYSYHVGAAFKDNCLVISDWALGDVIEANHIDSDIEHYVIIKRKDVLSFIQACSTSSRYALPKGQLSDEKIVNILGDIYKDDKDAIFGVQDILKSNDIPYEFQVW